MRVLLDTCVLSELRLPKGDPRVRHAVDVLGSDDLFISVLTVGEIAKGIALLRTSAIFRLGYRRWNAITRTGSCPSIWKSAISGEN